MPATSADLAKKSASNPRRFLLLVLSTALGVAVALQMLPVLFRSIETDLSRSQILLAALRKNDPAIHTVALGNSVIMCGIDARRLTPAPRNPGQAINLSSTGQSLLESLLYYQELPASISTVIQAVSPYEAVNAPELPEQKYNALYLYGYRPKPQTAQQIDAIAALASASPSPLHHSDLDQVFQGRWAMRSMVDTGARQWLRRDLQLDASNDLFFPHVYTARIPSTKYRSAIEGQIQALTSLADSSALNPAVMQVLTSIHEACRSSNKRLVFLLPPINPQIRAAISSTSHESLVQFLQTLTQNTSASIIDASALLPEDQFVDAMHPTKSGATTLTDYVQKQITKNR